MCWKQPWKCWATTLMKKDNKLLLARANSTIQVQLHSRCFQGRNVSRWSLRACLFLLFVYETKNKNIHYACFLTKCSPSFNFVPAWNLRHWVAPHQFPGQLAFLLWLAKDCRNVANRTDEPTLLFRQRDTTMDTENLFNEVERIRSRYWEASSRMTNRYLKALSITAL